MRPDYHMHLEKGPFESSWLQRFVDRAQSQGVDEIGVTEHAYRFDGARTLLQRPYIQEKEAVQLDDYLELLIEAKASGLPVRIGIEIDYVPEAESGIADFLNDRPWDYVIGSVHWLDDWGFDLGRHKSRWESASLIDVYEQYFQRIEAAARSGLFDVIGHLDVIKVFGYRPDLSKPGQRERYESAVERALDAVAGANVAIEINTAGWRKPVHELYPAPELLPAVYERGIAITMGSDAHRPEDVGAGIDEAVELAYETGYRQVLQFEQRRARPVTLT